MEKLFKEETIQEYTGVEFPWQDSCSDSSAVLIVDEYGFPNYASYGSKDGSWCSRGAASTDFDDVVRTVMEILLDYDVDEFKIMRDFLSSKSRYKQMAESIRKDRMSKYDF